MSLSPLVSFKSRFVTYLLNFPRKMKYMPLCLLKWKTRQAVGSYLQDLVADLDATVAGRRSVWVQAAHEHSHSATVLVPRQTEPQALSPPLQLHRQHRVTQGPVLLLHFICNMGRKCGRQLGNYQHGVSNI